ncbi:MAG: tetraacyldisaccharide 4'-kinase [Odoribacteraceae bacterium]|nr:tetraacyldisaccharide 4'-kinase [Odoribacteraceae bacterium]
MRAIDLLACPASWLYGAVVVARNFLFDRGMIASRRFASPVVVCVGNVAVGGTGKTPHVEAVVAALKGEFRVACLSRGYGRSASGGREVGEGCSAREVGDEPRQLKNRFPDVAVMVDGNRTRGIERLIAAERPPRVVVMDDGFQHRRVTPRVSVLLVDHGRPPSTDHLLPRGRLREPFAPALRRANAVIVTKCPPSLPDGEREEIRRQLRLPAGQLLLFSTMSHGTPAPLDGTSSCRLSGGSNVLCVTGIARPGPFVRHLQGVAGGVAHLAFPDHHRFSGRDVRRVVEAFRALPEGDNYLFTTEKDATRLPLALLPGDILARAFQVPVEVRFLTPPSPLFDMIAGYARGD